MDTWQEALMLLHEHGWNGELVDEACTALLEACAEGALEGREVSGLSEDEVRAVLDEPVDAFECRALTQLARVHDRADPEGASLRAALRDLDAFAAGLGEG